jgi:hypothetical protein
VIYFSVWADDLEDASTYLQRLPQRDLRDRVSQPDDPELLRMARLDCDWDAECLRCFTEMTDAGVRTRPAKIAGARGLLRFVAEADFSDAVPWLFFIDQKPASIAPVIGRLLQAFTAKGGRVFYWAYDEASRNMDCFATGVAPYVSVLIHDESPLADPVRTALPADCRAVHRSWVANVVPFAFAFDENPEERIVFLASRLGVTGHRMEQVRALEEHFGERFRFIADHSVPVSERGRFAGVKVHVCPEGRKFDTPGMSATHTDRPFWSGCMGQVPVAEDSRSGGRLEELARSGRILRYAHGDTRALIDCCERALAMDNQTRRAIYDYFNRYETVGPAAAREIAAFHLNASGAAS